MGGFPNFLSFLKQIIVFLKTGFLKLKRKVVLTNILLSKLKRVTLHSTTVSQRASTGRQQIERSSPKPENVKRKKSSSRQTKTPKSQRKGSILHDPSKLNPLESGRGTITLQGVGEPTQRDKRLAIRTSHTDPSSSQWKKWIEIINVTKRRLKDSNLRRNVDVSAMQSNPQNTSTAQSLAPHECSFLKPK